MPSKFNDNDLRNKDSIIIVSTARRDMRDSDADPDFDPDLISQMSEALHERLGTGDPFRNPEIPLEKYVPSRSRKCRFWRKICCCSTEPEDSEEKIDDDSRSRSDDNSWPVSRLTTTHNMVTSPKISAGPTLESTNIRKKHKKK